MKETLAKGFAFLRAIGYSGRCFAEEAVGKRPGREGRGVVLSVEAVDDELAWGRFGALSREEEET